MTNPPYLSGPYTSAQSRARIVVGLLLAGAALRLIGIPLQILELSTPEFNPEQALDENPGAAVILLLQAGVGLLTVALFIATVVFFLMWLYRAANNVRAFGRHLGYSPGWAVGSFFVPFANLVIPYRGVKEVWKKSGPPESISFGPESAPAAFPLWWLFWIVSNFADNIALRMTVADAPRDPAVIVSIAGDVLSIVAAIFCIMVVREIDRRQEESSKHLPAFHPGTLPPPPPVFHPESSAPAYPQTGTPSDRTF